MKGTSKLVSRPSGSVSRDFGIVICLWVGNWETIMKIAIIGAGAIGSVVAGYLSKLGHDLVLVGRPDQVEAILKNGLHIKGARGDQVFKIRVKIRLDEQCDWTIFTVKTQDIESAYSENHEFLEEAQILTTQNGIQADNLLSSHFEPERMTSSIVMFGATYIRPGEVTFNFEGDWIIGKPFVPNDPVTHEIADILQKAFRVVISSEIMGMKWLKLFVNFNNCIPALIGRSMQETFADMDFCKLSIMLLREGLDIIAMRGIEMVSLPQFPMDRIVGLKLMPLEQAAMIMRKTLTTLSAEPLYGSILQSIMRGKASEIDFINGEVVVLAGNLRRTAPLNERVVALVHRVEREGRFFSTEEIKREFKLNQGSAVSRQPSAIRRELSAD